MNEWVLVSDKLPSDDSLFYVVKFKNGKTSIATFDELDEERPFCPWRTKSRGKYYWHGYPKDMIVSWRIYDPATGD